MAHPDWQEMPNSNLPTSDPMVRQGAAIALEEPILTNPTMGTIKAQPIPADEQQVKEQFQRQNHDKEQVYQLENMLATSTETHAHYTSTPRITGKRKDHVRKSDRNNGESGESENSIKPIIVGK